MLNYINPIKILVLLTFIHAVLSIRMRDRNHLHLLAILSVCLGTEIITSVLYHLQLSNALAVSISIILHDCLWLLLLYRNVPNRSAIGAGIALFILTASINLLLIQETSEFCYYTFVIGGFIYTVLFLFENFSQIKSENMDYFMSNIYLLLFAPVLFFISLSLMFGFDSREVTSYRIFPSVILYDFVIYFVNIIYYSLINIYIYREKRQRTWIVSQ